MVTTNTKETCQTVVVLKSRHQVINNQQIVVMRVKSCFQIIRYALNELHTFYRFVQGLVFCIEPKNFVWFWFNQLMVYNGFGKRRLAATGRTGNHTGERVLQFHTANW